MCRPYFAACTAHASTPFRKSIRAEAQRQLTPAEGLAVTGRTGKLRLSAVHLDGGEIAPLLQGFDIRFRKFGELVRIGLAVVMRVEPAALHGWLRHPLKRR